MKLIDFFPKSLLSVFMGILIFPVLSICAENARPADRDFSMDIPGDWIELPLPLQGVIASYGKKGTLATFHVMERELDEVKDVRDLQWRDLFSPRFADIRLHTEGVSTIGGERARFCVYSLKPGEFKQTMEGKLPAKYINYIVIHDGKLFSVTFKDTQEGFAITYPSFLSLMRTLQFTNGAPKVREKRS